MAVFWKNHLKDVDFSENALKEVPLGLFQLDVSQVIAPYFSFSAFARKPLHVTVLCTSSELLRQRKNKLKEKFNHQDHLGCMQRLRGNAQNDNSSGRKVG